MWDVPAVRSLLPFLVIGVTTGSIYAIAGMGLVLTYRTSGVFNFAHGTQAAAAAFLFYQGRDLWHLPWPVAALLSLVLGGVALGLLLERLAYALQASGVALKVVATVGLLIGIQSLIVLRYGAATITFKPFLPTGLVHLPSVNVRVDQLITTFLAAVAAGGLYAFFRTTRLGVAVQAVAEDPNLLGLQGTSPNAVRRQAWVVGSCFAAVSGLLLAETVGLDAALLTLLIVQAFGAAAVGAFTSLVMTYAGGLIIGIGAALATKYLAQYKALQGLPVNLPFLVLFIALLVIPRRLLVERQAMKVRGERPPVRLPSGLHRAGLAAGVVALVVLPHLAGARLPTYTSGLTFVILFASLGLLVRTSGQVSLCHMAFAAVGASTFARALDAGFPWPLAVLAGGLMAVPIGAVVAVPAIRLAGVYLAVATFGLGILLQRIFYGTFLMFGAANSLEVRRPTLFGLHLTTDIRYYYVVLAVTLLCCAAVVVVRRSRLGRFLRALADSPAALTAHGVNTNLTRLFVFCISAFLAGLAGALLGPVTGSASALSFDFFVSLLLLAVLAITGRQPVLSAFVAAGLYAVAPSYLTTAKASTYAQLTFGVLAVGAAVVGQRAAAVVRPSRRVDERAGAGRVMARAPREALEPT